MREEKKESNRFLLAFAIPKKSKKLIYAANKMHYRKVRLENTQLWRTSHQTIFNEPGSIAFSENF